MTTSYSLERLLQNGHLAVSGKTAGCIQMLCVVGSNFSDVNLWCVVGVQKSVHLLHDVGKLGVAEALDVRDGSERFYKRTILLDKRVGLCNVFMIAPAARGAAGNTAEFRQNDWLPLPWQ